MNSLDNLLQSDDLEVDYPEFSMTPICPDCGEDERDKWYIHPQESAVKSKLMTKYTLFRGKFYKGIWNTGKPLECNNCLEFISNLYVPDCDRCPDTWRWLYKWTRFQGHMIVMYGEDGGELVFDENDIRNANNINCQYCRNAVFELTRQT